MPRKQEPKTSKKTAIYARISSDREGLELGAQRQLEDCRARAARDGLEVAEVYIDNDAGASRYSRKPRPEYQRMVEEIQTGTTAVVIAYSNSRLTRRPREFEDLITLHEQTGVRFLTVVSGDDDLSTADGRMVARIKASVDAAEAERISERVKRAKLQAAEEGRSNGGQRAFGWADSVTADTAQKRIVQEWARRLLAGESLNSLARDMNRRGIPTVTGVPWTSGVIQQILVSPRVAGWRARHGEILSRAVWEPLLDEPTWQEIRLLLTDPQRDKATRGRVHLLTSLALCGYCEKPVGLSATGSSGGTGPRKKYFCADCRMYREVSLVDRHVEAYMVELLTNLEDVTEPDMPSSSTVAELRQRIQNNVIKFADSDVLSDAEFEVVQRRLKARLEEEESKLAVPRRQRLVLGMTGPDAAAAWSSAPLDRKRKIIDAFVEIRLYRGRPGSNAFDPKSIELLDR